MDWTDSFSPAFGAALKEGLESTAGEERRVVAFDADGTLWDKDIGEAFLRWLIAGGRLKNVDYSRDIYRLYEEAVKRDRTEGYAHAVKLMAGLREKDVMEWSGQLAYAWPNYRQPMLNVVEGLEEAGFEVWIISASNQWTIRATAPFAGFDPGRCIGIRTEAADGIITDEIIHPLTCNQGKVETIEQVVGIKPVFAFGDSMGDYEMLEYSRYPMVVGQLSSPNRSMLETALSNDWPVQMF